MAEDIPKETKMSQMIHASYSLSVDILGTGYHPTSRSE